MREFNEDTRVKIPATIQFLRLGYKYMSLDSLNLHSEARIDFNLLKTALEKINKRPFEIDEVISIIEDILLKLKTKSFCHSQRNTFLHMMYMFVLTNGKVRCESHNVIKLRT